MTKRDLVERISEETGIIREDTQAVIQKTLDYITDELVKGGHVEFRNFGVFETCIRKACTGRNPKNPHVPIPIPAHKVVRFKPGKIMKERVLAS